MKRMAIAVICTLAIWGCDKKAENAAADKAPAAEKVEAKSGAATAADKGDKAEAHSKKAVNTAALTGKKAAAAAASGPTVTLVDAGSDPKRALRLKPKAGDTQAASMVMNMDMKMGMGGQKMPMKLPGMKMNMSVKVDSVNKAGDATYGFKLDSVDVVARDGVDPGVVTAMKQGINGLVGMAGKATVTSRGYATAGELQMPAGANPQMKQMVDSFKQSMDQMSIPLPEEPVGVGAKWKVVQAIDQNGMKIAQTATFEVVKIDGDKVDTKFSLAQTAAPQKIDSKDMPAGADARLKSLKGSGTGTTTFNLAKVMPEASDMTVKSSVSMSMKMGNQEQAMDMDMDVQMIMTSK